MKQVVLLMTNKSDLCVVDKIQQLLLCINPSTDFFLLYNTSQELLPSTLQPYAEIVFCFSSDILYSMGYMPLGDSLIPGSCHFPLLKFYLTHPEYDYYWLIEDDVFFSGNWGVLFDYYCNDTTDMLSSRIMTLAESPQWDWWYSLNSGRDTIRKEDFVSAFNPICRLSKRALQCVHESLLNGWRGHAEVVVSTILKYKGLSIKDIGGKGSFTPEGKENLFYKDGTHSHIALAIHDIRPNTIYHPIKQKKTTCQLRKNCVISAVGRNSLHRNWLNNSENRTFDLHLIVYDDSFSEFYGDADFMSFKKGFKLKLVYDYLNSHQDYLNHYAYFFIPDEDIMTDAQSIEKLFDSMNQYSLKIAQPALKQSYFTYPATLQEHFFTLRYTNFVEMMLPCFSQEALNKVLFTFNENESGWGSEYHWPLLIETNKKDMAIIDSIPMIHTQPVKEGRINNEKELNAYLRKFHITPHSEEYGFVIDGASYEVQMYMKNLYEKRKNLILANMRMVPILLKKIKMGEISRRGLDGMLSIVLYLKVLAFITEAIQYDNVTETFFNTKEDLKIKESISNLTIGIEELKAVLEGRFDMKEGIYICRIMLNISEIQLKYKSDNNLLLHHCWLLMNELCQVEMQMKGLS